MGKEKVNFILVCGYGWSGSSAVVDLLREFSGFWESKVEFRLIKERYGIAELENALTTNWSDPIETDLAVKDFLEFVNFLNRVPAKFFSQDGLGYQTFFKDSFLYETNRYLENFIKYEYQSFWHMLAMRWSITHRFLMKTKRKLSGKGFSQKCYFTERVSTDYFEECTKDYIEKLYYPLIQLNNVHTVILDQAIPANKVDWADRYFRDAKVIVVDRDPRDIYVDLVKGKNLLGEDLSLKDDASKFIAWFNSYRFNQNDIRGAKNVLFLKFEDLVLDYENTIEKVRQFCGADVNAHFKPMRYFDPNISKNNIGLWKNYHNQNVINDLYNELHTYCYVPAGEERRYL